MKNFLTILIACSSLSQAEDESSNYLNFIIQTQNDENRTQQLLNNIQPTGSSTAPRGVTGSSVFTLWTIHRTELSEYLLDEKTVSSYHPEATIRITSMDSYQAVPRTRIDHPFTVEYSVSGLITNDKNAPDAAKSVILEHQILSYNEGTYSEDSDSTKSATQSDIVHNGSKTSIITPSIIATDLTLARGTETFTISAQPDFNTEITMLARATVQIWPIAQATVSGIKADKAYLTLPDIHFDYKELYPNSTTHVRFYKGSPRSNPEEPITINTVNVIIDDVTPQTRNFTLSGKSIDITESGSYTIEVIHQTPFGSDILVQVYPLTKKFNIKVVGALNSSE